MRRFLPKPTSSLSGIKGRGPTTELNFHDTINTPTPLMRDFSRLKKIRIFHKPLFKLNQLYCPRLIKFNFLHYWGIIWWNESVFPSLVKTKRAPLSAGVCNFSLKCTVDERWHFKKTHVYTPNDIISHLGDTCKTKEDFATKLRLRLQHNTS